MEMGLSPFPYFHCFIHQNVLRTGKSLVFISASHLKQLELRPKNVGWTDKTKLSDQNRKRSIFMDKDSWRKKTMELMSQSLWRTPYPERSSNLQKSVLIHSTNHLYIHLLLVRLRNKVQVLPLLSLQSSGRDKEIYLVNDLKIRVILYTYAYPLASFHPTHAIPTIISKCSEN